jgi:hypothetical protein
MQIMIQYLLPFSDEKLFLRLCNTGTDTIITTNLRFPTQYSR